MLIPQSDRVFNYFYPVHVLIPSSSKMVLVLFSSYLPPGLPAGVCLLDVSVGGLSNYVTDSIQESLSGLINVFLAISVSSPNSMEPESPLAYSEGFNNRFYPERDKSVHRLQSSFFKMQWNVIFSSMTRSYTWSVSFRFTNKIAVSISLLSHTGHKP